jgi:hypothetical protein
LSVLSELGKYGVPQATVAMYLGGNAVRHFGLG